MQIEVIQYNTEVAMETLGKKKKMADSRFALSNQNIVEKLEENAKNKNTLKTTQTWLNVWQHGRLKEKKLKNTSKNNSQSKTSATE